MNTEISLGIYAEIEDFLQDLLGILDYPAMFPKSFKIKEEEEGYYTVTLNIMNKKDVVLEFTFNDDTLCLVGCDGDCEYCGPFEKEQQAILEIIYQLI